MKNEQARTKMIAELYVPAAQKRFDVRIPLDLRVHELTRLLSKLLSEVEPGSYAFDADAVLCEYQTGNVYSASLTPREMGWKNGIRLLLL